LLPPEKIAFQAAVGRPDVSPRRLAGHRLDDTSERGSERLS
jgi:hypothetical protein